MAKRNTKIKKIQATAVIQQNMNSKCIYTEYNKKHNAVVCTRMLQSGSHPHIIKNASIRIDSVTYVFVF